MHTPRSTLATTTNPLVLVTVTWALLWGFGAGQTALVAPGESASGIASLGDQTVWEESWSARYPGCVSLALWPQDEQPVAVVTRTSDGTVSRVAADRVARTEGRVVGACR